MEKNFYIYSVSIKSVSKSISIRDMLVSMGIGGCFVSPKYIKDGVFIYILDTKLDSEFISNPYIRPIPLKYHDSVSSIWKQRSNNYKHILCLGFGKDMIIKHYSKGLIKNLVKIFDLNLKNEERILLI